MKKTYTIRLGEDLQRAAKAKAAREGKSFSDEVATALTEALKKEAKNEKRSK